MKELIILPFFNVSVSKSYIINQSPLNPPAGVIRVRRLLEENDCYALVCHHLFQLSWKGWLVCVWGQGNGVALWREPYTKALTFLRSSLVTFPEEKDRFTIRKAPNHTD